MKNISKIILAFILGIIVSFSMNVAAEVVLNSESVSYFNSKTTETTVGGALNELFSAIEISKQIGDMTKIASIGDGTITGAISGINNTVSELNSKMPKIQRGRTKVTYLMPLTIGRIDVVFDVPYETTPHVVASLIQPAETNVVHRVSVTNVTNTGFRMDFYNGWSGGATDLYADWIAVS